VRVSLLSIDVRCPGIIRSIRGCCKVQSRCLPHQMSIKLSRFDENYALASTQNLKNKDIPEGGAKGTILPSCVVELHSPFEVYSFSRA